jgi:thiamine-monophosphate kinase
MQKLSESHLIARIQELFPGGEALTDDCGEIPAVAPGHRLLATTDLMEEGQHFRMVWHPPEMLGRKLLVVNLSDLDASGARPLGFTLTLALGRDLDPAWLDAFLRGLAGAAREFGVPVLGGDTVGRHSGLGLGITAFGEASRWLRRDQVQAGDGVFVDQPLGRSLRGLQKLQAGARWKAEQPDEDLAAHLNPSPNLGLGLRLAGIPEVHACIDLSDGLSKDLRMLAEASGLSITVEPGLTQEEWAGGEDYSRCFTASIPQKALESRLGLPLRRVATAVDSGSGPLLIYDGTRAVPLPDQSFNHFEPSCPP